MRRRLSFVLLAACASILLVAAGIAAQDTNENAGKAASAQARWSGVIVRSNKDTSTLTVRKGRIEKIIHYDASTKWTQGSKEGVKDIDMSEFKDGSRVICLGQYNDKKEFVATRIDLRVSHMMP